MIIYDALKKDHDKLRVLLDQMVSMSRANEDIREQLIKQVRDELIPHSRAEESVFYNSLRESESTKDLGWHGFEEHLQAETYLRTLQGMEAFNADWTNTAKKLKAHLEHHISEEEGRIFDAAKKLFTEEEAQAMGEAFEEMKPKVREGGMLKSTFDLIANMMPPRFADKFRSHAKKDQNLSSGSGNSERSNERNFY